MTELEIPYPDFNGLRNWIQNEYTEERWSEYNYHRNSHTGGKITVIAGEEHPAYSRFVRDLRPKLHEHGFVVTETTRQYSGDNDTRDKPMIRAIPLVWVVLYVNGHVCSRGACRHITESKFCEDCSDYFSDESHKDVEMIHP